MNQDQSYRQLPAPCIVESGILVNKQDIKRLIDDLTHVRYIHLLDDIRKNEGEGWVLEVFNHPNQSTLVVNNSLYINIQSFDYLQIKQSSNKETEFCLIQDNRELKLTPLNNSTQEEIESQDIDSIALESMLSEVLSAKWDVQLDEEF